MTDGIIMLMSIMHLHMHILHRQYGPLTDLVIDRFRKDDATSKQWTPCLLSGMITCGRNVKPMLTPLDVRWFVIDRAVMAYKETETDVLYGVEMAWRWRHCSRVAHARLHFLTAKWLNVIIPGKEIEFTASKTTWKWRMHLAFTSGF
jgi:hypothetical protein